MHLCQHFTSLCMLAMALAARPMMYLFADGLHFGQWFWALWWLMMFAAVSPTLTYTYARYVVDGRWSGFRPLPGMIALGCGLCVNNAMACMRGLTLVGGEFVRTPKSGSSGQRARVSTYQAAQSHLWLIELILGAYTAFCFVVYMQSFHSAFSIFMLCYAFGFTMLGWHSRPASDRIIPPPLPTVEPAGGS